jgi:putative nucleotidyltransferase with HDIG domain
MKHAHPQETDHLDKLVEVVARPEQVGIQKLLDLARGELGLDLAYISEFDSEHQVVRAVEGDAESFSLAEGTAIPLAETFCARMVAGAIPNLIADVRDEPRVRDLAHVSDDAGVGAYLGVPVRFADGRMYGSFCLVSHGAEPSLEERDVKFVHVLARLAAEWLERRELEERNWQLQVQTVARDALLAALEARDGYTGEHSSAVVDLAVEVARKLGLDEADVADVAQVALLHDVGKIAVPDSILRKSGSLDEDEWMVMETHPAAGAKLVEQIEGLAHLAPSIRAEHERWDGTGYPEGLQGEDIPFASRIVLACDAWHAMTSDRPYRRALEPAVAIAELERNAGTQFDARVVSALVESVRVTGADAGTGATWRTN